MLSSSDAHGISRTSSPASSSTVKSACTSLLSSVPLWWSFVTAEEADDLLFRPAPVISIRLRQKPAVSAIFRFNEADVRITADHLARARQHQDERIVLRMNYQRGHGDALEVR